MSYDTDIVIAGGGLNGSALALALAAGGFCSIILDPHPRADLAKADFDGRAYALALTSVRMLSTLGVWQEIEPQAQPILDIKVSDGRAGEGASPLHVHFDHHELGEGPMGHMVEDRHLRTALLDALEASPFVTPRYEVQLDSYSTNESGVQCETGSGAIRARILAGCDGRGSAVAKQAGIARVGHDYEQSSLVCAVSHERPHNSCAHQFFTPSGPLAILPLTADRSAIVWTEERATAERIHAMDDAGYMEALRPVFGDFLGQLKLAGKRFLYPLSLDVVTEFIADRIVLVGDAAHGIHPLAGQGFNLGLRDSAALAQVLSDAKRRGEDIGAASVAERYQGWRRADTAAMVTATDGINALFSNDNPLLRSVRDMGLGMVNAIPALRQSAMRHAAGLGGNVPRLMQGKPL